MHGEMQKAVTGEARDSEAKRKKLRRRRAERGRGRESGGIVNVKGACEGGVTRSVTKRRPVDIYVELLPYGR